jgi:hypothetical protein
MNYRRITRERTCPVCKGSEAYRIRRAGISIKLACRLLNLRPHYCPSCDTFFLGPRHTRDLHIEEPLSSGNQPQAGSLLH